MVAHGFDELIRGGSTVGRGMVVPASKSIPVDLLPVLADDMSCCLFQTINGISPSYRQAELPELSLADLEQDDRDELLSSDCDFQFRKPMAFFKPGIATSDTRCIHLDLNSGEVVSQQPFTPYSPSIHESPFVPHASRTNLDKVTWYLP